MRRLRDHFQDAERGESGTVGEQLRRINMLMELSRMLGDLRELERHFGLYLSILGKHRLLDMVLVGGSNAIETSMLWGRAKEANALMNRWLDAVAAMVDLTTVKGFAAEELLKGHPWTTIQLLDRISGMTRPSKKRQIGMAMASSGHACMISAVNG